MKRSLLLICLLIASFASNATSLGECSTEKNASFDASDAVVLAKVVSITESSPQPPKHDVVTIKIEKYWKRKGALPEVVYVRPRTLSNKSVTYLLFLKEYGTAYQPEICSPIITLGRGDLQRGIESVFDLATKEVRHAN